MESGLPRRRSVTTSGSLAGLVVMAAALGCAPDTLEPRGNPSVKPGLMPFDAPPPFKANNGGYQAGGAPGAHLDAATSGTFDAPGTEAGDAWADAGADAPGDASADAPYMAPAMGGSHAGGAGGRAGVDAGRDVASGAGGARADAAVDARAGGSGGTFGSGGMLGSGGK